MAAYPRGTQKPLYPYRPSTLVAHCHGHRRVTGITTIGINLESENSRHSA
jgi:hypothetical protein